MRFVSSLRNILFECSMVQSNNIKGVLGNFWPPTPKQIVLSHLVFAITNVL